MGRTERGGHGSVEDVGCLASACKPSSNFLDGAAVIVKSKSMDPHSRLSQFNQRAPKAGPMPQSRYPDLSQLKPSLEGFGKRPSARKSSPAPSLLVRRPIASNSRVKQDEKYRKDMHLAFVNNALQQKAAVSVSPV